MLGTVYDDIDDIIGDAFQTIDDFLTDTLLGGFDDVIHDLGDIIPDLDDIIPDLGDIIPDLDDIIPDLGDIGDRFPDIPIPKILIPKLSIPKISIPKIPIPKISIPKISIPKIPSFGGLFGKRKRRDVDNPTLLDQLTSARAIFRRSTTNSQRQPTCDELQAKPPKACERYIFRPECRTSCNISYGKS